MDRIIHDLANGPAHLNYSRFLDLIADHDRNPNQYPHGGWLPQQTTEMPSAAHDFYSAKPGSSFSYSSARNEPYKAPTYTELKSEPMPVNPIMNCKTEIKSEPMESNPTHEMPNHSIKRVMCGVCSVEVPEAKFDDHRYAEHLGLARPYGMSQEFSDSEKRRELKKALLLKKQVSCPYCYRIFTSTLGFQYHQTRCLAEVGETPKHVECYLCGKQVAALRAHLKIHRKEEKQQLMKTLEEMKIISCNYCDSKYSTITGYLYHKERCRFAPHPPLIPILKKQNKRKEECEICGKKVLILKSHMKLHERAMAKSE